MPMLVKKSAKRKRKLYLRNMNGWFAKSDLNCPETKAGLTENLNDFTLERKRKFWDEEFKFKGQRMIKLNEDPPFDREENFES